MFSVASITIIDKLFNNKLGKISNGGQDQRSKPPSTQPSAKLQPSTSPQSTNSVTQNPQHSNGDKKTTNEIPRNNSNVQPSNLLPSYDKLENFLRLRQWEKADRETSKLINHAAGHNELSGLSYDKIQQIPCETLRRLNQLWINHSGDRFGFSKQRDIYLDCGGQPGQYNPEVWEKFGDQVGWKLSDGSWILAYKEMQFTLNAPIGHFPVLCYRRPSWIVQVPWNNMLLPSLADYLAKCRI
jgi:hypothetical protein